GYLLVLTADSIRQLPLIAYTKPLAAYTVPLTAYRLPLTAYTDQSLAQAWRGLRRSGISLDLYGDLYMDLIIGI
ncbi:hypothetical protein ORL84_23495, partial [Klebsiella oxytoca]